MKYYDKYKKLIDLILLFVIISIVTIAIKYYIKPIFFMIIIIFLCNPIYKLILSLKIPKKIAGALSILIINIIVILLLLTIGSSLYKLLYEFYKDTFHYSFIADKTDSLSLYISENSKINIAKKIWGILKNFNLKRNAISTGNYFLAYFVGNLSAFFFIIDKEKIYNMVLEIIPIEVLNRIIKNKQVFRKMVVVEFNLLLISTFITTIGFLVLHVNNPVLLGILCGILDLLPYVGTIIVFIPIIIYNIIVKDYFIAFGLICLYILVQVLREILEAKFLSDKLEIHPLLIILSVYIGMKLFGFIGLLVGPMYGILAKEIIYDK